MSFSDSLYARLETALLCQEVAPKLDYVNQLLPDWYQGRLVRREAAPPYRLLEAPRPPLPVLVPANKVPRRSLASVEGHAALIHAIVHIEFNAINLALDAAWRFREMPDAFISDWLQVAAEEVRHFVLLSQRLAQLGFAYGDFPAHNGLWEMSCKTDGDALSRMALVPRVLEARGLDVTPGIQAKLAQIGDTASVAILDIILREEIGHVRIGNHWFRYLCQKAELDPWPTFQNLLQRYALQPYHGYYNLAARKRAGFHADELAYWQSLSDKSVYQA